MQNLIKTTFKKIVFYPRQVLFELPTVCGLFIFHLITIASNRLSVNNYSAFGVSSAGVSALVSATTSPSVFTSSAFLIFTSLFSPSIIF